jgi:hypothetical protein
MIRNQYIVYRYFPFAEYRSMSRHSPASLPIAYTVLRGLILLNWLYGAGVLFMLAGMFFARDWMMRALGFAHSAQSASSIGGMRAIALLGLLAIPLNLAVLNRLVAMVETVRAGDPFVAVNAYRLQAVAWFLLGLQLLSLAIGLIGKAISVPAHPFLDAGVSPSGWLAVILVFILARVFAEGTLMREDLEGTV